MIYGDDPMNRRVSLASWVVRTSLRHVWAPAVLLLGLLGCVSPTQEKRAQSEEDPDRDRYEIKTVGDISTVGNAEPIAVGGVGLVVGLDNTGGETLDEDVRRTFEHQMSKGKKAPANIKEMMNSPDSALVLVSGVIPPGIRKDDTFDIEVCLPPHSKATSLRGGRLLKCPLFNYDMTKNLMPNFKGPNVSLHGHQYAWAGGPVMVGLVGGEGEKVAAQPNEEVRTKQGLVWGGGKSTIDASLLLMFNADYRFGITSQQITMRINELFQGSGHTNGSDAIAMAQRDQGVLVRVPPQYRLNVPRFLRVVRLIPHQPLKKSDVLPARDGDGKPPPKLEVKGAMGRPYFQRLADDLLDPARTVVAALRLEALGTASIPVLQEGLKSKDALVRFCSAEALAYLGSPSSGEELGQAVAGQPMLRAFGLTALASLDESVSRTKLQELLTSSTDDETRYGAFRALRALDEGNEMVQGIQLNDAFWVHMVAPNSPPLVHLSTTRRPEIVIFGPDPDLLPPFSLSASDFIVTATPDDERCTVTRVSPLGETERRQCPLKLTALLRSLADLGAQYPEVVDLLKEGNTWERLASRVRLDALPQATTVMDLAHIGRGGVPLETDSPKSLPDLGATPTLYENVRAPRSSPWEEGNALMRQNPLPGIDRRTAQDITPGEE
jgi:Flagellar P-ring protein